MNGQGRSKGGKGVPRPHAGYHWPVTQCYSCGQGSTRYIISDDLYCILCMTDTAASVVSSTQRGHGREVIDWERVELWHYAHNLLSWRHVAWKSVRCSTALRDCGQCWTAGSLSSPPRTVSHRKFMLGSPRSIFLRHNFKLPQVYLDPHSRWTSEQFLQHDTTLAQYMLSLCVRWTQWNFAEIFGLWATVRHCLWQMDRQTHNDSIYAFASRIGHYGAIQMLYYYYYYYYIPC